MTPICPLAYKICQIHGRVPNVNGKPIHRPYKAPRIVQTYTQNVTAKRAALLTKHEAILRDWAQYFKEEELRRIAAEQAAARRNLIAELGDKVTIKTAISITCDVLKLDIGDVLSIRRNRPLQTARQIIAILARDYFFLSYPQIGRAIKRDHSTVIHAHTNGEARRESDLSFASALAEIESQLRAKIKEAS